MTARCRGSTFTIWHEVSPKDCRCCLNRCGGDLWGVLVNVQRNDEMKTSLMTKTLIVVAVLALWTAFTQCSVKGGFPHFKRANEALNHESKPHEGGLVSMAKTRDGTNYIGVYLGMIAEHDGHGAVYMYSATSGQCLKYIPYQDFVDIFVTRVKPEYPSK
jgi:hypothetical protein